MTTSPHWTSISVIILLATIGFALYKAYRGVASRTLPYPPGPPRLPILGSVHLLPQEYQEKTFAEWGKTFGDLVFAKLFRTPTIIINSFETARDLMEKRSRNYSSRPRFILMTELMGWKNVLTHTPYGDEFRLQRKWIQEAFQTKAALDSYRALQRREVNVVLANLLSSPNAFMAHFTRFSASVIMEICYGHRVTSDHDKFIHIAERAATATVTAGSAGSMLVDFFPILKLLPTWMPGAGFKRRAFHVRELVKELYDAPYSMASGIAWPSFTSTLLEQCYRKGELTAYDEDNIKGAAAVIYAAGTETTATVMITFILAMVTFPDIYKKLQEEVGRVVGSDRLPDFDDRESLPYVESVIKESYRWHVPVPLGIPHNTMKPDVYNGYYIPQNSMVIGNIWNMSQDESVYLNPEEFRPERFLGETNFELDPKNFVFGFGRRQCPGADFADRNIFLLVASLAATMDLAKAKDSEGREITPPIEFTSGFVCRPKDFVCQITPRSEKAAELIKQMNAVTGEV
ncbi:unnamed protein product [Somion occarium]|uniref:Cytochrome P450 n=1 Tax=Somion occarium TaxID=3059160 RepID=A0ABP1CP56_9APHY